MSVLTTPPPLDAFAALRCESVDGLSLAYRDYPAAGGARGEAIVCLHGLTRNARDFDNVAPRLASLGRRVIVPDVRGRGLSDRDPDPAHYDIPVYVNDLVSLLGHAGVDRCVVIGTSMGALIGAAFNLIQPGRVTAMVMNDVGPKLGGPGMARIAQTLGGGESYDTWAQAAEHAERILGHVHPSRRGDRDFWDAYARKLFRDIDGRIALDYDPGIMTALKSGQPTPDLWPLFDGLAEIPTLLLRGALSDLLEPETVEALRRRLPRLSVREIPDVGHAPTLEEEDAVRAVKDFVQSLD